MSFSRLFPLGSALLFLAACSSDAGTADGMLTNPENMEAPGNTGGSSDPATGGTTGGAPSAAGGQGSGGLSASGGAASIDPVLPETTTLEGVTYEAIECGAPINGTTQAVFGPDLSSYGGWDHMNTAGNEAGYFDLGAEDWSSYDFKDTPRIANSECAGDLTLRGTLVRKFHEHTQKHSNGLQVQGTFPDMSQVSALVIDLKLESGGTDIPSEYEIHDGLATVRIETDGTTLSPRYRIDPALYLDQWIRITIPVENFGSGTPAKLQHVAELADDGKINEGVRDYEEIDMTIHQMVFVLN